MVLLSPQTYSSAPCWSLQAGMLPPPRSLPRAVSHLPCYYDARRTAHCVRKPGEHIVFMGDSLTRYQWLALAASFHRKVELSDQEFPSLVKEREWRHWMPFYNGSTEALMPNKRCDCHRSFARPVGSKTIENRYFWLEAPPAAAAAAAAHHHGGRRGGGGGAAAADAGAGGGGAGGARPLLNMSFIQVLEDVEPSPYA